jgi:hypothetical protein
MVKKLNKYQQLILDIQKRSLRDRSVKEMTDIYNTCIMQLSLSELESEIIKELRMEVAQVVIAREYKLTPSKVCQIKYSVFDKLAKYLEGGLLLSDIERSAFEHKPIEPDWNLRKTQTQVSSKRATNGKIYITNNFKLSSMFKSNEFELAVKRLSISQLKEIIHTEHGADKLISHVSGEVLSVLYSSLLSTKLAWHTSYIDYSVGDTIYYLQYKGLTVPYGSTEIPKGSTVDVMKIVVGEPI